MSIKESCIGDAPGFKMMQDSNELLTVFYYNYGYQPCSTKVLWKSQVGSHESWVLPKGSPLLPFLNYAYNKISQNGALQKIRSKWANIAQESICQSNNMQPISFHKIVSLFMLLFLGISWTFLILIYEVYSKNQIFNEGDTTNQVKEAQESMIVMNQIQERKQTCVMEALRGINEEIITMEIMRLTRSKNFDMYHKINVISNLMTATIEAIDDLDNK